MYLLFRLECFVYKKKNTPPDLKGMRNASTKHSATPFLCTLYSFPSEHVHIRATVVGHLPKQRSSVIQQSAFEYSECDLCCVKPSSHEAYLNKVQLIYNTAL